MFDRKKLKLKPLSKRENDLDVSIIKKIDILENHVLTKEAIAAAKDIIQARKKKSSVIFMLGGHVIRSGVQRYLIDLMKRGYISNIAVNGSVMIHDFELALIGATTESVAKYIKEGQFGLWEETGRINDIINDAFSRDSNIGMGEAVGREIFNGKYPYKDVSIFAAAYQLEIPITVHVGIGYDIIHEHPNCRGDATGALSYNDFLKFASVVSNLENGVVLNFGSAVMAPEVFLKALSMARNIARQKKKSIKHFTAVVCDLHSLPKNYRCEPRKNDESYYFRPWKTMLVRTVADGGKSYYLNGKHSDTIPDIWQAINREEKHG